MVVSVIICTRNRASLLADVLQTLCEQDFDRSRYEVVVVDNGSTDETRRITEDLIRRNSNVRYCCEATCGLSHARNRGWQEANGQYVAYIDDDCKAPPQWLTAASEIIDEHAPAVFGGPYYAFYQSSKPNWWDDQYGAFELSSESHMLEPEEFLRGGNLFIRRSLLSKLKGFDVRLGMSGQRLGYGEETELQDRVREMAPNERLYYDSNMYVHHLVRREKMTWRWILRSWFASGAPPATHLAMGRNPRGGRRVLCCCFNRSR